MMNLMREILHFLSPNGWGCTSLSQDYDVDYDKKTQD